MKKGRKSRKEAGEMKVRVKTRTHRKSEKWVNEPKEKQQATAMGWQMEADAERAEAEFWSSGCGWVQKDKALLSCCCAWLDNGRKEGI